MTNPIELVGITLLQQLKSMESITDDLLLSLHNVFPSNMVTEATKLVDERKIHLLVSESGRTVFKVRISFPVYSSYILVKYIILLTNLEI